jgi:hypothetical protein
MAPGLKPRAKAAEKLIRFSIQQFRSFLGPPQSARYEAG